MTIENTIQDGLPEELALPHYNSNDVIDSSEIRFMLDDS